MKSTFINVVLTVMSLWFPLFVTNWAFSRYYSEVDNRLASIGKNGFFENGVRWTWGHRVENNRLGFREREFESPRPPNIYRIMVLGDSLTWGAGLPTEKRYTQLLEDMLRRHYSTQAIEVLNFGFSGGPTVKERDVLLKYADEVEPNLIIVGFCQNDPQPKSESFSVERQEFWETYGSYFRALRSSSEMLLLGSLARWVSDNSDRILTNMGVYPDSYQALDRVYQEDSPEWIEFEKALRDIAKMAGEKKLPPPLFITLDQAFSYGMNDFNSKTEKNLLLRNKWFSRAREAAIEKGFIATDIDKFLMGRIWRFDELAVNEFDGHPSALLNRFYAQEIFDRLIENEELFRLSL